mmetsp:Transcript_20867/g.46344  ORF Transcript_20867/g.46344 Transcript_20867/m.46344 type:complete len:84 (-) Transcript_20867:1355-1606(-)
MLWVLCLYSALWASAPDSKRRRTCLQISHSERDKDDMTTTGQHRTRTTLTGHNRGAGGSRRPEGAEVEVEGGDLGSRTIEIEL